MDLDKGIDYASQVLGLLSLVALIFCVWLFWPEISSTWFAVVDWLEKLLSLLPRLREVIRNQG